MRALAAALGLTFLAGGCRRGAEARPAPPEETSLDAAAGATAAPPSEARAEPRKVGALNFSTSVLSEPDWPPDVEDSKRRGRRRKPSKPTVDAGRASSSRRVGYLRAGAVTEVFATRIDNEACPEGWYELVSGGFVCGKAVTFELDNAGVTRAPKQADVTAPLPYRYGAILGDGTPLYRRVLSRADRAELEAWPPAKSGDDADPEREEEREARRPTLDELRGRGPIVRRLARGFILALDREFSAADAKWWRTSEGFAVPFERVMPMAPVATPRGTWLAPAGAKAGAGVVAFVTAKSAHQWLFAADAGAPTWGPAASGAVELTGGKRGDLRETTAGFWMREGDGFTVITSPPDDLAPGEKWIDVDLGRQSLIAFTGMQPVFAARISSGRPARGDAEDRATPTGTFRIREKHVTATMERDVAGNGPYSIVDVPWVMYFSGSYALHGAFWHDQFGSARSHGCVNLAPADARALFHWVEPNLPEGWHGVQADPDLGTRVVVHGHTR